jgi:hypothetical protein
MVDDFESSLRHGLWSNGSAWNPAQPIETTRTELAAKIGRRRRAQVSLAIAAIAMLGCGAVLHHIASSNGAGSLDATSTLSGNPAGAASRELAGRASQAPGGGQSTTPTSTGGAGARPGDGSGSGESAGLLGMSGGSGPGQAGGLVTATTVGSSSTSPSTVSTVVSPTSPSTSSASTAPPDTQVPGTTVPTPPTTYPSTTPLPPTATTVPDVYTFTNGDSGLTEAVPVGATIELSLSSCPGGSWGRSTSSALSVVKPVASTPDPGAGLTSDTLVAESPGQAVLRARPVSTCATPVLPFVLTIEVDAAIA